MSKRSWDEIGLLPLVFLLLLCGVFEPVGSRENKGWVGWLCSILMLIGAGCVIYWASHLIHTHVHLQIK